MLRRSSEGWPFHLITKSTKATKKKLFFSGFFDPLVVWAQQPV